MSLSERLLEVEPPSFGLPCGISEVQRKMNEDDKAALEGVMSVGPESPKRLSNRQIQNILFSEGYEVSYSSVSLHRRKQCRCFTGKARSYKNVETDSSGTK
jgi:hypothetical protein